MRLIRTLSRGSALLLIPGILLATAAGAGSADVLSHKGRDIGAATLYGRYTVLRCRGSVRLGNGCQDVHGVHVKMDTAGTVGKVENQPLYDLVGPANRPVRARLKEDPVTHRVNGVYANGGWRNFEKNSQYLIIVTIPLLVIGLVLIAFGVVPLARWIGRRVTGKTTARRWMWALAGAALFAFCVAVANAGLSGDRYDVGRGEIFAPYASFGSTGFHEGVSVHVDQFDTVHKAESTKLYGLLRSHDQKLPVDAVQEDGASEIAGVTYQGRSYKVGGDKWIALIVFVPLALIGVAAMWLNGAALLRDRRPASALPV